MPIRIRIAALVVGVCVACFASVQSQTKNPLTVRTKRPAIKLQTVATTPTPLLTKQEQALLDEINKARANPTAYITFLELYKTYYHDKSVQFPDGYTLITNEGVTALDEAIKFLRTLKPLPPLEPRKGMVSAAKVHLDDLQKTGGFGHTGSDGSKPEDRLSRFGSWESVVGEDIVYDSRTALYDVIGLIIDDGVATRGHRNNLFKPAFKVIGISLGQVNAKTVCVITFAGGFVGKEENKKPSAIKY